MPCVSIGSAHSRSMEIISWKSLLMEDVPQIMLVCCTIAFVDKKDSEPICKAIDSKFSNFVAALCWNHLMEKFKTVAEYWNAIAWSLKIIWEGWIKFVSAVRLRLREL